MPGEPTPQTMAAAYAGGAIPRNLPVPGGPVGPPPIGARFVATGALADAWSVLDPVAANIAQLTREAIAGVPDAVRTIVEAAPSAATVFGAVSGGLGAASLTAGLTGAAAKLLAAPLAAVPYVGAGTAAWAGLSSPVAGALGLASAGFQALATGSQALPSLSQWGQFAPNLRV